MLREELERSLSRLRERLERESVTIADPARGTGEEERPRAGEGRGVRAPRPLAGLPPRPRAYHLFIYYLFARQDARWMSPLLSDLGYLRFARAHYRGSPQGGWESTGSPQTLPAARRKDRERQSSTTEVRTATAAAREGASELTIANPRKGDGRAGTSRAQGSTTKLRTARRRQQSAERSKR